MVNNVIPKYCFQGCTGITAIKSRYKNSTLEGSCFKGCDYLTTAELGASCVNPASSAFSGCTYLATVTFGGNNPQFTEIADSVFYGCQNLTQVGKTANVIALPKVGSFGESAFEGCTNLQTVVTESQAYYLYNRAFKNCASLTQVGPTSGTVRLGSNTDEPQEEVFMGCTSITKLGYKYGSTNIGDRWFKGCTSLATVLLANTKNIGESAFEGCKAITAFNVSVGGTTAASTMTIGKNAFKGCTAITYAQFDQVKHAITAIPEGMFEGCTSLAYASSASNQGEGLKTGDLNGITSIGANAFKGCDLLTRYGKTADVAIFPADLAEIGASAFEGCAALKTFRLYKMDAAPTLGEDAFTGIASDATFYIYPNNSYLSASNYAKNDSWKVWFDDTNASYKLYAYVNKTKQYGTVSCDVPLSFAFTSTPNLYKVVAADDSYSYLKKISNSKLPANTGAVIEVGTQTSGANAGNLYTSQTVRVLFDGSAKETDFTGNLLVANVTENANFKGQEGDTYNLLMSNGKFVKATDGILAAGLAYLPRVFSEGGEAKELSISFDEPTSIRTIDNVENTVDNDAWYTVNGVRLQGEPATKGVYIHNGKKVVVK